jgi:transcriptional regulator with XRE-family HTH domain
MSVKLPNLLIMNLKKQLRLYLEYKDMTASQLAKKSTVPKQSLSDWLAGSNPRDVRQIKRVADVLGISIDHLMFGEGIEKKVGKSSELNDLLSDEWVSGQFEIKIRRIKK